MSGSLSGTQAQAWKGGRVNGPSGYMAVYAPGHPRAGGAGRYVLEHILVAEKALGRPLAKKHPVHHVDEDKSNNAPGNLVVCENNAYHHLLHQRQRALNACGDPGALKCVRCGKYDRQDYMYRSHRPGGAEYGAHKDCHNAHLAKCRRSS